MVSKSLFQNVIDAKNFKYEDDRSKMGVSANIEYIPSSTSIENNSIIK